MNKSRNFTIVVFIAALAMLFWSGYQATVIVNQQAYIHDLKEDLEAVKQEYNREENE